MIRLARIHAESDIPAAGLDELARAGPLELLQLDYVRPRRATTSGHGLAELPECAHSVIEAVSSVCRSLFLEPDFRVVTSAGWSNAYGCVERIAQALVDAGQRDVPLSAVRGSNLMGILDFLVAEGLALDNAETGAPWRSLREPVLAADLQLGAGPVAAALGEGARVIVAGCYDGAAPAIAAGVHEFNWSWKELDHLAGAAGAARAAIWPNQHACDWLGQVGTLPAAILHSRVELEDAGAFQVNSAQPINESDAQRLLEWLQAGESDKSPHRQADVEWTASSTGVSRRGPTQLRVEGCKGAPIDDPWRVEVLYQAGFVVDSLIEFSARIGPATRRQIAEAFRTRFVDAANERSLIEVQELASTPDAATADAGWLYLVCHSKLRKPCQEFVAHVERLLTANAGALRSLNGRPTIQVECGLWPTSVPRSAIDIAVDTRPAKEWA